MHVCNFASVEVFNKALLTYLLTYLLFTGRIRSVLNRQKVSTDDKFKKTNFFSEKILGRIFLFFYRTRSRVRKQLCLVLFVVFNSHVQTPLFDRGKGHLREPVLPTAEASHETL